MNPCILSKCQFRNDAGNKLNAWKWEWAIKVYFIRRLLISILLHREEPIALLTFALHTLAKHTQSEQLKYYKKYWMEEISKFVIPFFFPFPWNERNPVHIVQSNVNVQISDKESELELKMKGRLGWWLAWLGLARPVARMLWLIQTFS